MNRKQSSPALISGCLLASSALFFSCSTQVVGAGDSPCTRDEECDDEERCSETGTCEAAEDEPSEPQGCRSNPNVVFMLAQSGAMSDVRDFGDEVASAIAEGGYTPWDCPQERQDWRWNVLRNVLLHPETGVVQEWESDYRFGLAVYSSDNGNLDGGSCPILRRTDLTLGARQDLLNSMGCAENLNGDSPTRESLTLVAEELAQTDFDGPKVIVLFVGGASDSCDCPGWTHGGLTTARELPDQCVDNGQEIGQDKEFNYQPSPSGDGASLKPSEYEDQLRVLEAARIHQELGVFVEVVNMSFEAQTVVRDVADDTARAGGSKIGSSIAAFDPVALRHAIGSVLDAYACGSEADAESN